MVPLCHHVGRYTLCRAQNSSLGVSTVNTENLEILIPSGRLRLLQEGLVLNRRSVKRGYFSKWRLISTRQLSPLMILETFAFIWTVRYPLKMLDIAITSTDHVPGVVCGGLWMCWVFLAPMNCVLSVCS